MLHRRIRGGVHILQGIGNMKILILEKAQCMIRQDLHLLHIAEALNELPGCDKLLIAVGDAGHENMAHPDGHLQLCQIPGTIQNVFVAPACEPLVPLIVNLLDVEEHQVRGLHEALELGKEGLLPGKGLG